VLDGAVLDEAALDGVALGEAVVDGAVLVAEAEAAVSVDVFAAPPPLIAVANAARSERAAVSFALVSASRLTAAVALDAELPEVPVGRGSVALLAPVAPVIGASANNSPITLSAAAASLAHLVLLAPAVAPLPTNFCRLLRCFFSSATCDLALPLTALDEMLLTAASAFCRCSCGVPC